MEVNFVFHILLIIRFACLDKVEIREESLSENLLGFDILSFSYLELFRAYAINDGFDFA